MTGEKGWDAIGVEPASGRVRELSPKPGSLQTMRRVFAWCGIWRGRSIFSG